MKKVKQLKGWGIYENNTKEFSEYGFKYTVLTPNSMECADQCSPSDTDWECDTLEQAVDWIKNY